MLLIGPPGTGKSMLAKRFIGLLPDLTEQEMIDVNIISSITKSGSEPCKVARPFREPHHSCSMPALIGGGKNAKPGEITMAHNGVLFLDELTHCCNESMQIGYLGDTDRSAKKLQSAE
ncbi:MAG: Competence protein ComM [Wolbachia endosymbiont of Ctenocephalides orientis wCori]|nr:MAG: Competence protein ComM [Wolbachia endosymbiont of Ctenocephalides orientis wCori]